MYYTGKGGSRDNREARKWFQKSAEQVENLTQGALGIMLNEGIGGPVDRAEAVRWLQFGAKLGYADARAYLRNIIHDVVYPSPGLKSCVAQCRSEYEGCSSLDYAMNFMAMKIFGMTDVKYNAVKANSCSEELRVCIRKC